MFAAFSISGEATAAELVDLDPKNLHMLQVGGFGCFGCLRGKAGTGFGTAPKR